MKILTERGTYWLRLVNSKNEKFYVNEEKDVMVTDSEGKPLYNETKAKKYYEKEKRA